MRRSWWIVCTLSVVLFMPGAVLAGSKPAGLPANQPFQCPDCQESARGGFAIDLDINTRGITLRVGASSASNERAPAIDATSPTLLPAFLELMTKQAGDLLTISHGSAVAPRVNLTRGAVIRETDRVAAQARQLYEVGEMYRRLGFYGSARMYFQRVQLLQPASDISRQATERLTEMHNRLREAEESGGEEPEASFRRMRERTMPLGLVEITY